MMIEASGVISAQAAQFALIGLATGALTALVALSVVLVYRASGVLNFAAGALGAIGAFVSYSLTDSGAPVVVGIVAGLAVGTGLGVLTFVVMALLRQSSVLTKLVATLGLFSAAQAFMTLIWGSDIRQPKPYLPSRELLLFGSIRIGEDRLLLIGIALVLAVGLRLVYSRTLFGLASSAVAENRRVASGFGWSANKIELTNFALAGLLSALAAILIAPIVTLTPAVLSVAILPALAAALVGRFSSFAITVLTALLIGALQSEVTLHQPDIAGALGVDPSSITGLPQALPLLIIVAVTVFSGSGRLQRGEQQTRLPQPGSGRISLIPLVVGEGLAVAVKWAAPGWSDGLIATFGMAIVVCSIVVVSGYAGQVSLCQYALAGFGAWLAARVSVSTGAPFLLSILVGVVGAIVAGALVALPALRTRGVSLAVSTLALALLFYGLIFSNSGATGGFAGLTVHTPSLFGLNIDPSEYPARYATVLLVALTGVVLIAANLRRGPAGRRLLAIRSNERAAAALGVRITEGKLYVFALGAGMAAIGGIFLAFRQPSVQFGSFDVFGSILVVQFAVIGGLGWGSGAVAGAALAPGALVATLVNKWGGDGSNINDWLALVAGIAGVLMLPTAPDGTAAWWSAAVGRFFERFKFPRPVRNALATKSAEWESAPTPATLGVSNVKVAFGGVVAVDDVSFAVGPGEIVGLIGPNGAGKTTVLDAITGFTRPKSGAISLDGADITKWSPERRAQAGLARSWQAVELFDEMTVLDNLLVAADDQRRSRYLLDLICPGRQSLAPFAAAVVADLGLEEFLSVRPSTLPQGVRRMVGIARTAIARPRILLLDEPAAGLGPAEGAELATAVTNLARRRNLPVVIIEHDVPLLMGMCDRIVALNFGRRIADGSPAEISTNEDVVRAYLGSVESLVPAAAPQPSEVGS